MKKVAISFLGVIFLLAAVQKSSAMLPRGARMYIEPFQQFDAYLGAAFSQKGVPVILVSNSDGADLKLSILNDGESITGMRIESKEKEILWTYVFSKPVKSERKQAEKCASELLKQFPLSPEELARREEERRSAAATAPQLREQVQKICIGQYHVLPGNYLFFPFQVTSPAIVKGHFEVVGGTGNDIQVVIGPRSDVMNWMNRHGGSITFASEKLTAGNLEVPVINPGDYLIAFSNAFSVVSVKVVAADVDLVTSGQP